MAKINIGELLGPVLGTVIREVLTSEAKKNTTEIAQTDIPKVEPKVTKAVLEAVKEQMDPVLDDKDKVIENQTNNEPAWKSRVLRGAVVGLLGLAVTVFKDYNDDGTIPINDLYGYAATAWGFAYVIYGRLTGAGTPSV